MVSKCFLGPWGAAADDQAGSSWSHGGRGSSQGPAQAWDAARDGQSQGETKAGWSIGFVQNRI